MTHLHRITTLVAQTIRAARIAWRRARRSLRALWIGALRLALTIALIVVLGDGAVRDTSLSARITALARDHLFDYAAWEVEALWGKLRESVLGVGPYLEDEQGRALVLAYLETLGAAQEVEAQIERLYADPDVPDPDAAAAPLRAERDTLRERLRADQPLVERLIEGQVSAVLADEGFGLLGQVLPPVAMHFTETPVALIVSPRERIAVAANLDLDALPVEERESLEARIDAALGVSSLIVPLGGLSLYPAMIVEPSARDTARTLARAFEVTAHEWAHHYLVFYPLGWEYNARAETRIINETTATFFGRAVAQRVIARYYPELPVPQYPSFLVASAVTSQEAAPQAPPGDPDAPPPFDYAREMGATRARVDFLLWQGLVEAAEAYMDAQQRKFARHGYPIRKLNQAYFAFYGGYQGEPGAGGTDPTGPAIEGILARSATLEDFLRTLRGITGREQLVGVGGR
ncbi:MAG: hypothetical protein OZ934_07705 [Anaerolineae bacterium]|nr:hypothetical protein [Anaerolineae bacterium]